MSLTSANKIETNRYELQIAVDSETFAAAVEKAYQRNKKKINIPGFRRGKAPRHFIEKLYGEGFFYEDAVNSLYPQAYNDAVEEAKIIPVDRAEIEVTDIGKDGFSFKATVTVKPEVEITEYKGLKAVKKDAAISEEEIDGEIEKLRMRNARIIDVDDRPAQKGDNVVIDFEGFVDGEAFEGGKAEKFPLALGSGQFIPGFEDQVVGHSIGEEFEIVVTFPEDYHAEELRNQSTNFKVKLHEIKVRQLPEVDDEFVKDVSEFDTVAALREDLSKKLLEKAETAAQDEYEDRLIDAVIANMKAEIPDVMIENGVTDMVRDFEYRLQSQGLNLPTYLQYTGMDMDSFRKTFEEQASKQVKIRLALEKIAEIENFEVTEEEVNAQYEKLAEAYKLEVDKAKSFIPEEDVRKDLAMNKAIDLVKDTAIAEKAPADASKKEEETKEEA